MSRIAWHRPARMPIPQPPADRLVIAAPPQAEQQSGAGNWLTMLLPMLSSFSIAAYMMVYRQTVLIVVAIGIVTLSVGGTMAMRWQTKKAARETKDRQRARYLEHLTEVRAYARELAAAQRDTTVRQWPAPGRLWAIAERRRRVWERRPTDADFLLLRLGLGRAPLSAPLQLNMRTDPSVEYDAELAAMARRVVETCGTVTGQPAVVDLGRTGVLSIVGEPADTRALARALALQLGVLHAPDDVALLVDTGGADADWQWATWLPHTRDPEAYGEAGACLVASGYEGLADAVERELVQAENRRAERRNRMGADRERRTGRRLVVLIDGFHPDSPWARSGPARRLLELCGPESGVTVIALVRETAHEPGRVDVRARVDADGALELEAADPALVIPVLDPVVDRAPVELCDTAARQVSPLLLTERPEEAVLARTVSLTELLGTSGNLEELDPRGHWVRPQDENVLCAPVGVCADGTPLVLDLKEAARGGMGPHGLIVGATGSGKSELLRTLLTGLTTMHSPDLLSMVLIDFKGGATFAGMTGLPHVAGLITNLADDLGLVDRVRDALVGEQQRRQTLLRDAGNVDSVAEYQARQAAGGLDVHGRPLEPLPYLLVIVDEFGELLSLRPDFINLFVQIGRVGRSLGIHLLLATQRLEEGRLRGLESHLSYRICLRTFSAGESRTVLGTTDAYRLPQLPGSAYLKVAESVYERFRVAHISAPYQPAVALDQDPAERLETIELRLRERGDGDPPEDGLEPGEPRPASVPLPGGGPTQMQVVVERLRGFGQSAHQVWLAPLPAAIPLDAVLGPLSVEDELGLQAAAWPLRGSLRFPVGVIDLPLRQEQQPLVLDFSQTDPHLLLVGAPQSGKSTFLRTLMLSGLLTHSPRELQFSCVDYGGGGLHALAAAPHVSGVAVRGETERAGRVLLEARRLIDEREKLFRERGIASAADFRRLREQGALDGGPDSATSADFIVVIDNWGGLRGELPDVELLALDLAVRGPGVGVHLVLSANRWGDVRMNLRDAVGARLELRLNDAAESEISRKAAKLLPTGIPGRGISPPGLHYQALLARMDGQDSVAGLREAQDEVLAKLASCWRGAAAAPIKQLPELIRRAEVADEAGPGALIGIGERSMQPVRLDLAQTDQHCLVIGDSGSGKSTFLRTWMLGLAARNEPTALRFLVVDYRRALTDAAPEAYIGGYAGDAGAAAEHANRLAATFARRLPPANLSPRQLKERSWWQGPEIYLVVDDQDMVSAGQNGPLAPLLEYVAHSREIGFHIVAARRSSGFSRAMTSDPLVSRAYETGAAGMVLSADPREGPLLGNARGQERQPGRGLLTRRRQQPEVVQILVPDED